MTNLNRRFATLTATLLFLAGTTLTGCVPPSCEPPAKKQDGIPNVVVSDEIPAEPAQTQTQTQTQTDVPESSDEAPKSLKQAVDDLR